MDAVLHRKHVEPEQRFNLQYVTVHGVMGGTVHGNRSRG